MKRIFSIIILLCIVFSLSSCAALKTIDYTPDAGMAVADRDIGVRLLSETVHVRKNENVLVSPLSVKLALAMAANGADGETLEEFEALLGAAPDDVNSYLSNYSEFLRSNGDFKFNIANSIWYNSDLRLNKEFAKANEDYYSAKIKSVAFNDKTVNDINKWVNKATKGMIDQVVDELDSGTAMLIANALSFDAEWESIYAEHEVIVETFTSYDGKARDVNMMRSIENKYIETSDAKGFIKDYKGGKLSFAALLPDEGVDIYNFVDGLSTDMFEDIQNYEDASVSAMIPKFSSEFEIEMVSEGVLSALGIETATSSGMANFSRMLDSFSDDKLFINKAIHKTFISVNEKGTQAGAVTAESFLRNAIGERSIVLDRPFVYMILDNVSNTPIFMGVVLEIKNS